MTGTKRCYKIPILTRLSNIKFYVEWRDEKFYRMGFYKDILETFEDAISRLESKRLRREGIIK